MVAVSSLGLSLGRSGGCRQRMQRLDLGGRGAPAQLLDPTKDPLHVAHFGHAEVLQQRSQATWIPGRGFRPEALQIGCHQQVFSVSFSNTNEENISR